MKNANTKYAAEKCEQWNRAVPVGTSVRLLKDGGESIETTTSSEAYVCNSGYPVIFLEGVRGYYLLDRVATLSERT